MGESLAFDILFAGGGLSSGLTAYRLTQTRPDLKIAIVESNVLLGGNHTWSFHDTDITPEQKAWLDPFISYHWDSQSVAFPKRKRHLHTGYNSITAENFDVQMRLVPNLTILSGRTITEASADRLDLDDGTSLTAPLVFDGRGPQTTPDMVLGFQKFLGQEIELTAPHGLTAPIIMDATIPQTDGYRFIYVLPFTPTSVLIEDTYYADGHDLPREVLRQEIARYAHQRGWKIDHVKREEDGILPIVLDGNIDSFWQRHDGGPVPLGLRAGLFHPVTGYSLPDSVALAEHIATLAKTDISYTALFNLVQTHAKTRWAAQGFYRLLNRMLFKAAKPERRYIVLERFYGMSEALIERFYAGRTTLIDRIRVLAGKPPVPLAAALRVMPAKNKGPSTTEGGPVKEGLLG